MTAELPPAIAVVGAIDAATVAGVRASISVALADAPTRLVVDLADAGFVDSSGLGMLIDLRRAAEAQGTRLLLRRPPSQLQRLMVMTQTYSHFDWA